MLGMISLALALGAAWFGYGTARRFVRERLRYVEGALSPGAAIIAGVGGALLLSPLAYLLPLVTGATAIAFGLGVGLGTRAGASDVKRGYRITDGS
ncbi:MAG: hypothetical protein OEW77_10875 [Gemmatimonadota bacterium]|nr:hypothetical protein [Gemmatimonadota bacterium]